MTLTIAQKQPIMPTDAEIKLSLESSRLLAPLISGRGSTVTIKVVEDEHQEQDIVIPAYTLHLLVDILSQIGQGNAVSIVPIHTELTTQEAADILNVSRPFLIKLIEAQEIPYRKVGRHRRIRFADLMAYKQRTDLQRTQALEELTAQAQELNMGYE